MLECFYFSLVAGCCTGKCFERIFCLRATCFLQELPGAWIGRIVFEERSNGVRAAQRCTWKLPGRGACWVLGDFVGQSAARWGGVGAIETTMLLALFFDWCFYVFFCLVGSAMRMLSIGWVSLNSLLEDGGGDSGDIRFRQKTCIARGTTDPCYWVWNLNYLSS